MGKGEERKVGGSRGGGRGVEGNIYLIQSHWKYRPLADMTA